MSKKSPIGGQAVMEGVMMTNPQYMTAIAVRRQDGTIALDTTPAPAGKKPWYKRVPFVRGVVNFVIMLGQGMKMLNKSMEMGGYEELEEEPTKFEKWLSEKSGKSVGDIISVVGIVLGVALAVGLFILLPQFLISLLNRAIPLSSFWMSLLEGVLRLVIFLAYMILISSMKDIRRFFSYHGAEHMTVNCYENDLPITVENVLLQSTRHPRCGTSFLLVVMVISILVFSLTGLVIETGSNMFMRLGLRLALLPVVAGISYEVLMLLARYENGFVRALRAPGIALQRLTTRVPDASMCEVAIVSFAACLPEEERAARVPIDYRQAYEVPDAPADAAAPDAETA